MPGALVPAAIVVPLVCEVICSRHFISVIGLQITLKGAILEAHTWNQTL